MSRTPKRLTEIPFWQIERSFTLAPMRLGLATYPAVHHLDPVAPDGVAYIIRVLVRVTYRHDGTQTSKYDYFRLTADGEVIKAPYGYATAYRPARITGLAEAVAKYAIGGGP